MGTARASTLLAVPSGSRWRWRAGALSAISPGQAGNERKKGLYVPNVETNRLVRDERELLSLRFAAGLSSREIAAVVGGSEAAVKKRLTRTIQRLKERSNG